MISYKNALLKGNKYIEPDIEPSKINTPDLKINRAIIWGEIETFLTFDLNCYSKDALKKMVDTCNYKVADICTFDCIEWDRINNIRTIEEIITKKLEDMEKNTYITVR